MSDVREALRRIEISETYMPDQDNCWRDGDAVFGECTLNDDLHTIHAAYRALVPADEDEPITEEWLRSVGFKPKKYQGSEVLSLKIPKIIDTQWLETTAASFTHNGHFLICRWSPLYEDGTPPDRVEVTAKTCGQVRRLAAALGISLSPAGSEPRKEK